jgi:hypothetical protein
MAHIMTSVAGEVVGIVSRRLMAESVFVEHGDNW